MDIILDIGKLVARKNGNILIVTTLDKAAIEKKRILEIEKLTENQEPLFTKIFPISYASSSDLIKTLGEYTTKDRGKMSFDNRTNQLIVKDTLDAIERVEKMIKVLDTQTPQILIQAKIVEASEGFSQKIGFADGANFKYNLSGTPVDCLLLMRRSLLFHQFHPMGDLQHFWVFLLTSFKSSRDSIWLLNY